MKIFGREACNTSGDIEAVDHDITSRPKLSATKAPTFGLAAEWQERGLETFPGQAFYKLRLTLAPITAAAAG